MLRQEAAGYEVQLSIHDESLNEKKHGSLEEYLELTVPKLDWLTDCPVKAEGWVGKRYRKK
jgi:galactokinase